MSKRKQKNRGTKHASTGIKSKNRKEYHRQYHRKFRAKTKETRK